MTIRELSEHPENANEEDSKAFVDYVCLVEEMGKQIEPLINGVTMESGRTKEEIAYSYYVETMLMSAIWESFVTSSVQEYKVINL